MAIIAVGQPLVEGRTSWPERADLIMTAHSGIELRLFYGQPSRDEIRAVRTAPVELAWIDGGKRGAMLVYQIDAQVIRWSDTPFHAGHQPATHPPSLPGDTGDSCPMRVVLTDANTGIVRAIRVSTVPSDAADAIRATLAAQTDAPFDLYDEGVWVNGLYARYPGPDGSRALAEREATVTWTGGHR